MFEKFGNFDSFAEINAKAAVLLEGGRHRDLIDLATENGLDEADAEDLIDGTADMLCTREMAALGKLTVEAAHLDAFGVFSDWLTVIQGMCMDDEDVAEAVRRIDKSLLECFAHVLGKESGARKKIDPKIAKAAGLPENIYLSTMTRQDITKEIRAYYLGGSK